MESISKPPLRGHLRNSPNRAKGMIEEGLLTEDVLQRGAQILQDDFESNAGYFLKELLAGTNSKNLNDFLRKKGVESLVELTKDPEVIGLIENTTGVASANAAKGTLRALSLYIDKQKFPSKNSEEDYKSVFRSQASYGLLPEEITADTLGAVRNLAAKHGVTYRDTEGKVTPESLQKFFSEIKAQTGYLPLGNFSRTELIKVLSTEDSKAGNWYRTKMAKILQDYASNKNEEGIPIGISAYQPTIDYGTRT
jgi:hypothetical protein